jgi:periplasmic divalent cation tolerance protein
MDEIITVMTTADNRELLERIGKNLLEKRLVSCVQILGPMSSMYWWKGKIEVAEEWLCMAKTTESVYPEVEAEIERLHSYEVPEIISLRVAKVAPAYRKWVFSEVAFSP